MTSKQDTTPTEMTKVWYSLNDKADSVIVASDADVADLRDAIIAKNPPVQSLSPGSIDIYDSGATIRLDQKVSTLETSLDSPLIVVPPEQQPQLAADLPESDVARFLEQHNCDSNRCVLCCKVFHSLSVNANDVASIIDFCEEVKQKEINELQNYFKFQVPDVKEAITQGLAAARGLLDGDGGSENLYKHHFSSLYIDVNCKRNTNDKLEGYFDGFYINLLRQLLERNGISCQQREKKLSESRRTDRKVDLIASSGRCTVLVLESAMNGTDRKIEADRGKIAMEIYHVWKEKDNKGYPPLGVLVRPGITTDDSRVPRSMVPRSMVPVFEVYTMVQASQVNCLVSLDLFMTPMNTGDLDPRRGGVAECARFHPWQTMRPAGPLSIFIDACNGVVRIVEACKAIKKALDDEVGAEGLPGMMNRLSVTDSKESESVDEDSKPRPPGDRGFQPGTAPAVTPAKKPSTHNCCCAQYMIEASYPFEQTEWSEVRWVVHCSTGQHFVRKSERTDWHDHDDVDWNPFDTEVSVFMKLATATSSCTSLVKPVDVCATDRCIFLEELEEVNWNQLQSNPKLALSACIDVSEGVATLHWLNVAHCDIKASAVMVRRDSRGAESFVLCDFNLAVVNADQFEYSLVPFGSSGWSLRSHQFTRASAKDHDCFTLGLLLATSCCASACEIVETDGSIDYHDFLTRLVEETRVSDDRIRHAILQVAFSLCRLELSAHDALQTLRGIEEKYRESKAGDETKIQVMAAAHAREGRHPLMPIGEN